MKRRSFLPFIPELEQAAFIGKAPLDSGQFAELSMDGLPDEAAT